MTILIWYYLLLHYFNVTLFKINVINTAFFPYCTINAALLMLHHSNIPLLYFMLNNLMLKFLMLHYLVLHFIAEAFFSIIFFITRTYKTKTFTITRYYCIFPVPGKKEKKLKQSEIDVTIMIKIHT